MAGRYPGCLPLVVALVVWIAAAAIQLWVMPTLGHDEAAYVTGAQRLVAHLPGLFINRSIGSELLAVPGVLVDSGELGWRLPAVVVGVTVPLGAFYLGRAAFDARTGAWAAAILAGAQPMVVQNAELLGDLPSTGLVLLGVAVLIREMRRAGGPTWNLVWSSVAFAAAFYVRYASITVITVAVGAGVVAFRREILTNPRPIVIAAVVGVALFTPHFVYSLRETGSLLGVIRISSTATRLEYTGEGLVTYFTVNPLRYYGVLAAPVAIAGLLAGCFGSRQRAYLTAVAIGHLLILGIKSHAQPRYVFIVVALLVTVGVDVLRDLYERRLAARVALQRAIVVGATLLVLLSWVLSIAGAYRVAIRRRDERAQVAADARRINDDADGRKCLVMMRTGPQLPLYSGCDGWYLGNLDAPPSGVRAYVVTVPQYPIDPMQVASRFGDNPMPLPGANDRVVVIERTR